MHLYTSGKRRQERRRPTRSSSSSEQLDTRSAVERLINPPQARERRQLENLAIQAARDLPHPLYPSVTVGQIDDLPEIVRFAVFGSNPNDPNPRKKSRHALPVIELDDSLFLKLLKPRDSMDLDIDKVDGLLFDEDCIRRLGHDVSLAMSKGGYRSHTSIDTFARDDNFLWLPLCVGVGR